MLSVRCFLESWKDAAQTASYLVGILAAIAAVLTYYRNSQRERAQWAVQLYGKFFETDLYKKNKKIREDLDFERTSENQQKLARVRDLVKDQPAAFTDYLNFFEMVAFLIETNQVSRRGVFRLFDYYLRCLKRHPEVFGYINEKKNGFEQLSDFLKKLEP